MMCAIFILVAGDGGGGGGGGIGFLHASGCRHHTEMLFQYKRLHPYSCVWQKVQSGFQLRRCAA